MSEAKETLKTVIDMLIPVVDQLPDESVAVPERVEQWPEDDTTLREYLWLDWTGNYFWIFEPTANSPRRWVKRWRYGGAYMDQESRPTGGPLTRTTDPSLPQSWETLADVPENIERVIGKFMGHDCEIARSPLPASGWMMRVHVGWPHGSQWVEMLDHAVQEVTNVQEDQS
ncbi:hypothetical protein [Kocuria carniphila]|uniref:hypothetical protein n=1 Tax=Kocuria carniphila TaxID=262208 RepID=UPI0034CF45FD